MQINLQYLPFLLLSGLGIFLCLVFLFIAQFLGPKLDTRVKKLPFESGLESQGVTKKSKITINYYLVASAFFYLLDFFVKKKAKFNSEFKQ